MGRGVDPPGQARDDRQADPRQRRRQPLGDPQAVGRAPPRPHQGDRQGVGRLDRAPDVEQGGAGRGCPPSGGGIFAVAPRRRAGRPHAGRAPARPRRRARGGPATILSASFGPTPWHLAQGARSRRPSTRAGRAEPVEQCPAGLRADAGDHRQADRSRSAGSGAVAALRLTPPDRPSRPAPIGCRPSAGSVGQLDLADPPGQDEADPAPAVLLVAAHRVDQGVGVEPRRGRRQAEPLEQGDQPGGRLRADPAEPLGQPRLGDHARRRRPRRAGRPPP